MNYKIYRIYFYLNFFHALVLTMLSKYIFTLKKKKKYYCTHIRIFLFTYLLSLKNNKNGIINIFKP